MIFKELEEQNIPYAVLVSEMRIFDKAVSGTRLYNIIIPQEYGKKFGSTGGESGIAYLNLPAQSPERNHFRSNIGRKFIKVSECRSGRTYEPVGQPSLRETLKEK